MGKKLMINGKEATSTSNKAENIVYNDTTVKNELDALNSNKAKKLNIGRAKLTYQISAGGDISIGVSSIKQAAGLENYQTVICIPEGARPLSTWGCIPIIFYMGDSYKVHNIGNTADNIEVCFGVIAY